VPHTVSCNYWATCYTRLLVGAVSPTPTACWEFCVLRYRSTTVSPLRSVRCSCARCSTITVVLFYTVVVHHRFRSTCVLPPFYLRLVGSFVRSFVPAISAFPTVAVCCSLPFTLFFRCSLFWLLVFTLYRCRLPTVLPFCSTLLICSFLFCYV